MSMTIRRSAVAVAIAASLALVTAALAQSARPPDQFVTVNGIKLHYLDWGGRGDVLLFLSGLGDDVHRFDRFAPNFVDQYHAIGFTRRGAEPSEKPPTGYDQPTLANDIRVLMDVEGIRRATLIGHSIAGAEMTTFAASYPDRVTALVYLDAAYDYGRSYELALAGGLAKLNPDPTLEAVSRGARVHPNYARVSAPALAFFVLYDTPPDPTNDLAFRLLDASGYKREQIDQFRKTVNHARVIEWHDTNHMFFDDPKHVDDTVRIVRDFLAHLADGR